MRGALPALVALGAVALLWNRSGESATVYPDGSAEVPMGELPGDTSPGAYSEPDSGSEDAPALTGADPLDSFLYVIRSAEHNALDVASGAAYQTVYGGGRFFDLSGHPSVTGEWPGQPLSADTCRAAGIASGNCRSTAAGAYQFNVPTWSEVRTWGGPELLSFSVEDQDEGARRLLRKIGATDAIYSGDIAGAVRIAGQRWASLPGARGGQGQRTMAFVMDRFNEAQQA